MVNSKMFRKIQELKKRGYSKLAIGKKLNIDPATVRKYYNMKADEYHRYKLETISRDKLFDSFKDEILSTYKSNNYQKLKMSGVYDYLEEKFKKLLYIPTILCPSHYTKPLFTLQSHLQTEIQTCDSVHISWI